MGLVPFLLLPEFGMVEMMGILVNGDLQAPSGVQDFELVVDEDMSIMAPVGAAPALRLGVEDVKFKRDLAGIDSQEQVRKVAGGFVCHNVSFLAKKHFQTAETWQTCMISLLIDLTACVAVWHKEGLSLRSKINPILHDNDRRHHPDCRRGP